MIFAKDERKKPNRPVKRPKQKGEGLEDTLELEDKAVLNEFQSPLNDTSKFIRVQNKVPVVVERLLFSAVEVARQQVIVMTEEDTRGGFRVYAKII